MKPEIAEMLKEMVTTNRKSTVNWIKKNKRLSMSEFEDAVYERYEEYRRKKVKNRDRH